MKATLYTTAVGLIAVAPDGQVLGKPYDGNATEQLRELQEGNPVEALRTLIRELAKKGVSELVCNHPGVYRALRSLSPPLNTSLEEVRVTQLAELAVKAGLVKTQEEYYAALREVSLSLAEARVKGAVARRDLMIVQAVKLLDDLEKQANMLYGRLTEWYGLNFPELKEIVDDYYKYAQIVFHVGTRQKMTKENLMKAVNDEFLAEKVLRAAEGSLGVEFTERDEERVRELARLMLELLKERDETQDFIRSLMEVEAPNVSAVAGPTVGARLIALAGGLEALAKEPASTIQVLGAEKALFRYFRTGRGAPKHGVIFQHPYVHSAPKWMRGKIARALATKISIAAKIDYLSREDRGSELRRALDQRVAEIKEKYKEPPARVRQQVRRQRARGYAGRRPR